MSAPWTAAQRECLEAMGFSVFAVRGAGDAVEPQALDSTEAIGASTSRRASTATARAGRSMAPRDVDSRALAAARASGPCDMLLRIARGVAVEALIERVGVPADVASRRALWRALRPLRKAARLA